ncbi:MAG: hypothetical protein WAW96_12920 [Alphaproteobacteria bacterium]
MQNRSQVEDVENRRGRHNIPHEDKRWFAQILNALVTDSKQPQIVIAEALGVSRSWLSRAKKGDYGPWPRSIFEQKLQLLVDSEFLSPDRRQEYLSQYGFYFTITAPPPLAYLVPGATVLQVERNARMERSGISNRAGSILSLESRGLIHSHLVEEVVSAIGRGRKIILLIGSQASGKSAIAQLVAEQVMRDRRVYFIEARIITEGARSGIAEELKRISDGRSIVIIEDAHINPQGVNAILEGALSSSTDFFVTSRPSYRERILWNQRNLLATIENGTYGHVIRIEPSSPWFRQLKEEIVRRQLIGHVQAPPAEVVRRLVDLAGNDLWVLTSLARAYDGAAVNYDVVCAALCERLCAIGKENYRAPSLMLVIELFWQFEIPTPKWFLISQLGAAPSDVEFLLAGGHALDRSGDGDLSLQHPSLASFLIRTANHHTHLWSPISQSPNEGPLSSALVARLAKSRFVDIQEIFRRIRYRPTLIEYCLDDPDVRALVHGRILGADHTLFSAAELISDIALYGSEHVREMLMECLTRDSIRERLDQEKDLAALAYFIESLPWKRKPEWIDAVERVNSAAVTIGAESYDGKDKRLVYCAYTAAWAKREAIEHNIRKVVGNDIEVDVDHVVRTLMRDAQLCCKSGDAASICLKSTLHIPSTMAVSIAQSLDEGLLADKLMSPDSSASDTAKLISVLTWTDQRLATRLMEGERINQLMRKAMNAGSRSDRAILLWSISRADPLRFERISEDLLSPIRFDEFKETGWLGL